MIEVVTNSETTATIHKKKGGRLIGAWKDSTFYKFLSENNPSESVKLK